MGVAFTSLFKGVFGKEDIRILMAGLVGAGKTTIIYKLKLGDVIKTDSGEETVEYKNINLTAVDVGVQECEQSIVEKIFAENTRENGANLSMAPLYAYSALLGFKRMAIYTATVRKENPVVFVVDSNDRVHIGEAREELMSMLAEDELRDAVLLVFANKQDLTNAMNAAEITDKLGLHSLRNINWYMYIQTTCATSGDGLFEGLDWLSNQLK